MARTICKGGDAIVLTDARQRVLRNQRTVVLYHSIESPQEGQKDEEHAKYKIDQIFNRT